MNVSPERALLLTPPCLHLRALHAFLIDVSISNEKSNTPIHPRAFDVFVGPETDLGLFFERQGLYDFCG